MSDLDYWAEKLKAAERELDAATRRADVNAAAKKLMRAKAEGHLEEPIFRTDRGLTVAKSWWKIVM